MDPTRGFWRATLSSLIAGILIAACAPLVVVMILYSTSPPRADSEPAALVLLSAFLLGPSIMLGIVTKRAWRAAGSWDFSRVGGHLLVFLALLLTAILGIGGLSALVRLVTLLGTR